MTGVAGRVPPVSVESCTMTSQDTELTPVDSQPDNVTAPPAQLVLMSTARQRWASLLKYTKTSTTIPTCTAASQPLDTSDNVVTSIPSTTEADEYELELSQSIISSSLSLIITFIATMVGNLFKSKKNETIFLFRQTHELQKAGTTRYTKSLSLIHI